MLWMNMIYIRGHSQKCDYVDPIWLALSVHDYKGFPRTGIGQACTSSHECNIRVLDCVLEK
jgi:hypothetical protein